MLKELSCSEVCLVWKNRVAGWRRKLDVARENLLSQFGSPPQGASPDLFDSSPLLILNVVDISGILSS